MKYIVSILLSLLLVETASAEWIYHCRDDNGRFTECNGGSRGKLGILRVEVPWDTFDDEYWRRCYSLSGLPTDTNTFNKVRLLEVWDLHKAGDNLDTYQMVVRSYDYQYATCTIRDIGFFSTSWWFTEDDIVPYAHQPGLM